MKISEIKFDCKHFKGEIPCKPNKLRSKVCSSCNEYEKIQTRILIIKLGAIGDVMRSTPLLHRFKHDFPSPHITWVTLTPEILPKDWIDDIYRFDFTSVYKVQNTEYDIAINLDKDKEACMLLQNVKAKQKFGFTWKDNHVSIATPHAEHKLITGIFDNISKENTKNYLQEIFEICNMEFKGESYLLNFDEKLADQFKYIKEKAAGKKIIGLNTGCGKRWQTRLWPEAYWIELIKKLQAQNYFPLLLGGPDEDEMNKKYTAATGAFYPGTFSLPQFIALSSICDGILTAVSMMMHIAIGLKKPLILFVNIFNKHEFELYGNGIIVEPTSGCDCYYGNSCSRKNHCMNDISVETVYKAIHQLV
ncbi:MAG TPA: glycosyltransferase family 9 protein [Bacteroidia bacterium]|nr:glycosyltransferase family 9 protein [Bacteroidia bacterium]HNO70453.1 glycosyltransferase family 9 protein [Bacteroidia bacterium]